MRRFCPRANCPASAGASSRTTHSTKTTASVPLVRVTSRAIARAIPKDESYAVGLGDLVGRVGEVVIGPLDQGPPGRVSVADIHGNRHFVLAVAAPSSSPLPQGTLVLLVDRVDTRFVAVKADDELKPSNPTLSN